MMQPANFVGTNYLYSFWNDMNEPALFEADDATLPLSAVHLNGDGAQV
jgi:alpha-glucosidase (family GH31 glycosyl hydrolase)